MRLIIDGDGCPDIDIIETVAQEFQLEMLVFVDFAHQLNSDNFQTIYCDTHRDSVDFEILKNLENGDVLITQDVGLASLALTKHAVVLNTQGVLLTQDNIGGFLDSRYVNAKLRKAHKKTTNPHKRTLAEQKQLIQTLITQIKRAN